MTAVLTLTHPPGMCVWGGGNVYLGGWMGEMEAHLMLNQLTINIIYYSHVLVFIMSYKCMSEGW